MKSKENKSHKQIFNNYVNILQGQANVAESQTKEDKIVKIK